MSGYPGLLHATGPLSTPRRLVGPGPGRCGCQPDTECPRCDGDYPHLTFMAAHRRRTHTDPDPDQGSAA